MILQWPRGRIGRRPNGAPWLWILRARPERTASGHSQVLGDAPHPDRCGLFSSSGAQPPGPRNPVLGGQRIVAPARLSCRDETEVPEPASHGRERRSRVLSLMGRTRICSGASQVGNFAGEVPDQHPTEPFHGPKRMVNHHRTVGLVVRADVGEIKSFGEVVIHLNGAKLPFSADHISHHKINFGAIERRFSGSSLKGTPRVAAASRHAFFARSQQSASPTYLVASGSRLTRTRKSVMPSVSKTVDQR